MPRYDYQCGKGHVFEFERPFGSANEPKSCPECGSKKLERLLVPPAVQFKGSGWYKTDSRTAVKEAKEVTETKPEAKSLEKKDEKGKEGKNGKKVSNSDASKPI